MKILHVLDHSIPLHSGYTFRTAAILREQRKRGWQTAHLTSAKQGATASDKETVEGLDFHRTCYKAGALARSSVFSLLGQMNATARRIDEVTRAERPDLHAHSPVLDAWPAIRVGRRRKLPVIYEVRAFWEDAAVDHGTTCEGDLRYRASRALETAAFRRVDALATICEGLRAEIVARGVPAEKITVVPNAVDVERFTVIERRDSELEAKLGLASHEVVGFCGSFYAYEGLALLLRALPMVLAARPSVRVLLVGGGPEDAPLRAQVTSMGLGNRVVFTGRVPNAEIDRYYSLIDVLAFPRLSMRLTNLVTPLKPLEAMAMGRVVVASDVGGHRELIRDGDTGLLHAAGSVGSLSEALVRALAGTDLRACLSANGRRFVEHERTWSASVARYAAVYERLAGAARGMHEGAPTASGL